jgi:hypothetical protein
MNERPLYLICSESIAVLKECNMLGITLRSTKKSAKTDIAPGKEKNAPALEMGSSYYRMSRKSLNFFRKQSSDSSFALWTSHVAHLLAKESRPFSNGDFV